MIRTGRLWRDADADMRMITGRKVGLSVVLLALSAWFAGWLLPGGKGGEVEPGASAPASTDRNLPAAGAGLADESPFAIVDDEVDGEAGRPPDAQASAAVAGELDAAATDLESGIGHTELSDAELQKMIEQLRNDPEFLAHVLAQFEQAIDPQRLRRLANLLGRAGGEGLSEAATRMVYADDHAVRRAGLDLLGRVQSSDPAARAVIVDLLAAETDESLLVDTLNALAVPTQRDDGSLVPQVLALTAHPASAVRGSTVNILSRWADNATLAPVLEQGLLDEDQRVRGASVFALANGPPVTASMRQNLFAIAENAEEPREVRSGALLALQGDELDAADRQRLQEALDAYNTRSLSRARP